MAKIELKRGCLILARERADLDGSELEYVESLIAGQTSGSAMLDVQAAPIGFLRVLLDDSRLTPNQRAVIAVRVHGMSPQAASDREQVYESTASNPIEFGSLFAMLGETSPNCELYVNNRWYPVIMRVAFSKSQENHVSRDVALVCELLVGDLSEAISYPIHAAIFVDSSGQAAERSVRAVMTRLGMRGLRASTSEHNLKLVRSERLSAETGSVAVVVAPVLMRSRYAWWSRLESRPLGTPESPRRCVVEPELEVDENERRRYAPSARDDGGATRLPFVRLFSLETKDYVYADIDDVRPYQFDERAIERLRLPAPMLGVLTSVFDAPPDQLFGDLIEGKHGGIVVLAWGNPGVGKTLTAEVYAERTRRPLYVLELGELGTNVTQVEENLSRVFTRVARWNAVLQFDECEIFLAERGEDLERSAIVGIFLRLLDYYRGILFLTTNRPDVLDHAVLSRIMLKLHYPDLDGPSRAAVWRRMFEAAGLRLVDDAYDRLAETALNGREIRNLTRLAKILVPGGALTVEQVRQVIDVGSVGGSLNR